MLKTITKTIRCQLVSIAERRPILYEHSNWIIRSNLDQCEALYYTLQCVPFCNSCTPFMFLFSDSSRMDVFYYFPAVILLRILVSAVSSPYYLI